MEMAKIGPGVKGGDNRLTLTDEDKEGRDLFQSLVRGAGLHGRRRHDGQHVRPPRRHGSTLPPVMVGSHLDTQPTGGKFDGVLGVLGGLEVIRTLNDLGIRTKHPIEVVNWTNEEGSRFAPAMVASGVFAGVFTQEYAYDLKDAEGKALRRGAASASAIDGPGAGRQAAAEGLLRAAYRAGADPRGGGRRYRRRHAWAGPALVRRDADRLREPCRLDADADDGAMRSLGAARLVLAVQRDRLTPRAVRGRHGRRAQALSGVAQCHPGLGVLTVDFRHPSDAVLSAMKAAIPRGDRRRSARRRSSTAEVEEVVLLRPGRLRPGLRGGGPRRGGAARLLAPRHRLRRRPRRLLHRPGRADLDGVLPLRRRDQPQRGEDIKPEWATAGADVLFHAVVETAEIVG